MMIAVTPGRRVTCRADIRLPLTARQAWGQLRDFNKYAAHDHFHAGFAIDGGVPRAGVRLTTEHRYGPFRTRRVGRICWWREGVGFAFSDLCESDPQRAFPHVLKMAVHDASAIECVLTITVAGRWTSPLPLWAARLWLGWVFLQIVQRTRNELLKFALHRRSLSDPR